MKKIANILLLTFCLGGLMGCVDQNKEEASKLAMIDVNSIIGSGNHAQDAAKHIQDAQEI